MRCVVRDYMAIVCALMGKKVCDRGRQSTNGPNVKNGDQDRGERERGDTLALANLEQWTYLVVVWCCYWPTVQATR